MYTQRVPLAPPALPVPPTLRRRLRRAVGRVAPTASSAGAQPAAAAAPVGNVWLPIIPAARRRLLNELHRGLGEGLARGLRAYLCEGDQFAFAGLTLETFDRLAAEQTGTALAARFAVQGRRVKGFVLGGRSLAPYFARACLGPAGAAGSRSPTRLESALAARAFDQLLGLVSTAYAGAGVGPLKFSGKDETLRHSPAFGSDEYLLAFRYRIGAAATDVSLILAVSLELVAALPAPAPLVPTKMAHVGSKTRAVLPVAAAIVLGGWTVPMVEVAALKPGDELLLPDGGDAWLEVEGLRLRPLGVELAGPVLRVRPREASDGQT